MDKILMFFRNIFGNQRICAKRTPLTFIMALAALSTLFGCAKNKGAISISEQGSFAVDGSIMTEKGKFNPDTLAPDGQNYRGDHAYVFYQIPESAKKTPMVFLHGYGQSKKTWESTPDGRDGFQNIFLKRGYKIYLMDQPRRGAAGRSMSAAEIKPVGDEQMWFSIFRLGRWPDFYEGSQFPQDKNSLDQFFRQGTPNIGAENPNLTANALSELFDKIGDGILITHSAGGGPDWYAAMKNPKIKAIASYEPGLFVFPEGEVPPPMPSKSPFGELRAEGVPLKDFMKLIKIPIVLYFGDYIPDEPSNDPGLDNWRVRKQMAKLWVDAINKHGGDATLVDLPKMGIRGNTHFMFAELNNLRIAELLEKFIEEKVFSTR